MIGKENGWFRVHASDAACMKVYLSECKFSGELD